MKIYLDTLIPEGSSRVNIQGEVHVLTSLADFVVTKESADNARALAAMLLGAAENRDPKGYEIVRSGLAAPVRLNIERGGK